MKYSASFLQQDLFAGPDTHFKFFAWYVEMPYCIVLGLVTVKNFLLSRSI